MAISSSKLLAGFAGVMALDTVACAIPIQYIKDDLDRLNVSPGVQQAIPVVKAAGLAGMAAGLVEPRIGLAASSAFVAYFAAAVGVHVKEHDTPAKALPALGLGAWAAVVAAKSFARRS